MADNRSSNKLEYVRLVKEGPSKQRELVFVAATFIVSVILVVFAIKPTVDTILTVNREIKEKNRISEALDKKIEALSMLDDQYLESKDSFENLTLIYPTSGNFSLLLSNIDAIIARNNFILESVGFSEYDSENFRINTSVLKPWSVRLSVTGRKSNVINLLKDLENMPMYPVIESFSYNEKTDENGNIRYSVSLRIYHIENSLFYE